VADSVRQHEEILRRIERLARTKQLAGEDLAHEVRAVPGGAMHDENNVVGLAVRATMDRSQRAVVHPQLREGLPALEAEALDDVVVFRRGRNHGKACER